MHRYMRDAILIKDVAPGGKAKLFIKLFCLGLGMDLYPMNAEIRHKVEGCSHHLGTDPPATIAPRDRDALDLGLAFIDHANAQGADSAIADEGDQVLALIIEAVEFRLLAYALFVHEDNLS